MGTYSLAKVNKVRSLDDRERGEHWSSTLCNFGEPAFMQTAFGSRGLSQGLLVERLEGDRPHAIGPFRGDASSKVRATPTRLLASLCALLE
jgi:hypothetical protein